MARERDRERKVRQSRADQQQFGHSRLNAKTLTIQPISESLFRKGRKSKKINESKKCIAYPGNAGKKTKKVKEKRRWRASLLRSLPDLQRLQVVTARNYVSMRDMRGKLAASPHASSVRNTSYA